MSFRAIVYVRGSTHQPLYGANQDRLETRAIARLTYWEPGFASLSPERIVIQRHVREIDGNTSQWETIKTILAKDVPEDRQHWRARKAEHEARKKATQ